jgi:hypothetical protein
VVNFGLSSNNQKLILAVKKLVMGRDTWSCVSMAIFKITFGFITEKFTARINFYVSFYDKTDGQEWT